MTTVSSPLAGRAIGLLAVPDPVFSQAMVGPGTAIDPVREPSEATAPVDGVVVSLHPHAFVVVDGDGHGVLTHLGIDTVQLNGEGFELLVNKGDTVTRGQAVVRWNPAAVEEAASPRSARSWRWRPRPSPCPPSGRAGTWRPASSCSPGSDLEAVPGGAEIGRARRWYPPYERRRLTWKQRCEASV